MLQGTRDIRKAALWLGHADVRTTAIYLRVDPAENGSGRSGPATGAAGDIQGTRRD